MAARKILALAQSDATDVRRNRDDSWIDRFGVAYELHLNFYNDDMVVASINRDRLRVRALVDNLLAAADVDAGNATSGQT